MLVAHGREEKRRCGVSARPAGVDIVAAVPELRQLRTFVALADELNFTRAAERLHVGQQAVSKTVAQLERELGVELVERTTREVRLTAAGEALVAHGRPVLRAADAAFAAARDAGRGLSGTVRLGVSPAIGPREREELVRALRRDAPEVSVSVLEVRPGDVRRLLLAGALDLVITRTGASAADVDSAPLRPTPAGLFVAAGHRLAGAREVALRELDGERLLTWSPPGTAFTDLLVTRLEAAGARVEPVEARVTGLSGLTELADRGAVALLPADWTGGEDVVRVALAEEVTLPLLVQWPVGAVPAAVRRVRASLSSAG
jgi:DNA-binding transcriptional LysR family regulator